MFSSDGMNSGIQGYTCEWFYVFQGKSWALFIIITIIIIIIIYCFYYYLLLLLVLYYYYFRDSKRIWNPDVHLIDECTGCGEVISFVYD